MKTQQELDEIRKVTKLALLRIGLRCDFSGFNYFSYAIERVIEEPALINSLCTHLYTETAQHFQVQNPDCIERSMRHSINHLAKCKGFDALNELFHADLYKNGSRPTAGELIQLIAEYYNTGLYLEHCA